MTEADRYPSWVTEWMNNVDEIWCPTELDITRLYNSFNFNVLTNKSNGKLMPEYERMKIGVETEGTIAKDNKRLYSYHPDVQPIKINNFSDDRLKFVFNGSWNHRKGIKEILQAFTGRHPDAHPACSILF